MVRTHFATSVPKSLPTPDPRLHFTADVNDVEIALPAIREAPPGKGIHDEGGTGTAAADKDHLCHDLLYILLWDAQAAGEVFFHLPCSRCILIIIRIGVQ